MRRDSIAQGQVSCDAVDHHLAHLVVFARVCVDVLHTPQAWVRLIVVVECAHSLHDVVTQLGDLELLAEEVEVEKWSDVLFGLRVAQGAGIEPADEELEGEIIRVRQTERFGFALAVLFVVEYVAEEGGVVAEELFVYGPISVLRANVNVYEGRGEKSRMIKLASWTTFEPERRAGGEAFRAARRRWTFWRVERVRGLWDRSRSEKCVDMYDSIKLNCCTKMKRTGEDRTG